ncbi:aldo/keto reductase [Luteococcus sp. H138]|uniref:aldo/keto reductase n=1 Tax=unclassified Luteococcus TaxID=2639923 RepID=UPI00313C0C70
MQRNPFGNTGLDVTVLGLGAGQVGAHDLDDADAGRVLNAVLDLGITLIDTADCYGLSEERIGRHLRHRRDEYVLSSKCGHNVEGTEDWTPANVRASVERSLQRLQTDRIDVLHLHSCDKSYLADGTLADTMDELVAAGKVRFAAYSGENDSLVAAIESGRFASVETSVNLADQWSLHHALPLATERGLGVIAKRPIANAVWQYDARPDGVYGEVYWDRLQTLAYDLGDDPLDLALRFSAYAPGVCAAIMGTSKINNLAKAVASIEKGPLDQDQLEAIERRWSQAGQGFDGQV